MEQTRVTVFRCVLMGLSLALSGCGIEPGARVAGTAAAAPAWTVRRGEFRERVLLTGELQAVHSTDLSVPRMPTWQTALRWLENDGAKVVAGQKLAELDNASFVSTLEDRRLQSVQAASDLEQKEAEVAAQLEEKA